MNIFSSILGVFRANIVYSIFSLLSSVIISRGLGPEMKGEFVFFMLVCSIHSLGLRFGLDVSIIRFVKYKYIDHQRLLFSLVMVSLFFIIKSKKVNINSTK